MTIARSDAPAEGLPADVAVLCHCGGAVRLFLFIHAEGIKRQVTCPHCHGDLVLRDAW